MNATSRRAGAASLLFPAAYRRKVLSLLLLNPERRLHVREIARLTGTTAGTLNKELRRLQAPVATSNSSTYGRVKLLHPGRGGTVEL